MTTAVRTTAASKRGNSDNSGLSVVGRSSRSDSATGRGRARSAQKPAQGSGSSAETERATSQRPVYGIVKHRAEDLAAGDVSRNRYGKWDVVTAACRSDGDSSRYMNVRFEVGGEMSIRTVQLVDVQVVKPS